jgi:hypothetical protein
MFSTDYPHAEGGLDPLAKFAKALASTSTAQPLPAGWGAQLFLGVPGVDVGGTRARCACREAHPGL